MSLKPFLPLYRNKSAERVGFRLVKSHLRQVFFCQESLTENRISVENRVNLNSIYMAFGKLGRGLALAGALAATTPALAEDRVSPSLQLAAATNGQITDCVAFVREQRALADTHGIEMTRNEGMTLLAECRGGQLHERIVEQERILAALDERIRQLNLRLDDQARIIDENNQVIAFIVAINGQWVIQRQLETETARLDADTERLDADTERLNADTERMLREAEQILRSLVTS